MAQIVIEVPDALKGVVEKPMREYAKTVAAQMREGKRRRHVDYRKFEVKLAERTAAIERAGHQAALSALDIDAAHLAINGERYGRVGRHSEAYKTLGRCGRLSGRCTVAAGNATARRSTP